MTIDSKEGPTLWVSMCLHPFTEKSMLYKAHVKDHTSVNPMRDDSDVDSPRKRRNRGDDGGEGVTEAQAVSSLFLGEMQAEAAPASLGAVEGSAAATSSTSTADKLLLEKPMIPVERLMGPPNPLSFVTYAALGSNIFALGGLPHSSTAASHDVYTYSMASPNSGWFQLPSMVVGRVKPLTAILDGKLYVFGGLYMSKPEPWAEVFDPHSRQWCPLPDLGINCSQALSAVAALACETYKIILLVNPARRRLNMFCVQLNTWKFYDVIPRYVEFCCEQPVMVGDTIYYCMYHRLHAYNICRRDWLSTDICGFPMDMNFNRDTSIQFQSFFHIGGLAFYLVWSHEGSIVITRFRAYVTGTSLTAHVESSDSYNFGGTDSDLSDLRFAGALLM